MLWSDPVRLVYGAAVMTAIVWLLLAGQPLGGLVIVPVAAILLRRWAESGGLRRVAHRGATHT